MCCKDNHTHKGIVVVMATMFVCLCISCQRDVQLRTDAVHDRAAMPVLEATDVMTLISDSGVTRYRIKAPSWRIYDKATPAYWEFVEGICLEQFDEDLSIQASLDADYAYYNEDAQIWQLKGNVKSLNREGEQFETSELYWNQNTERVYSDSAIVITRATSIIHGIGFESNQEMTKYTILNPTGVFPINED